MNIGELENVSAMLFRSPFNRDSFYVVGRDGLSFPEFNEKYGNSPYSAAAQFKRASGANLDDNESQFFMVYVEDCFDPPIAIVRADDECEAIDIAVDAFEWLRVEPSNYGTPAEFEKAIEDGIVGIGDGSNYYDAEQIRVREVKPYRLEWD